MTTQTTIDIDQKVREVREQGYCVLPGHFPRETMAALYDAFRPIFDDYVASHEPNRGPGRYYVPVPMRPPFYDPAFFDDDVINDVMRGVLGERYTIQAYSTDTPVRGSENQAWHSDLPPVFTDAPDLQHPPAFIALNFSFLDVTPELGPFEVAPGTHLMDRATAKAKIEAGEVPLLALPLAMGDVLIRDPRCFHRGTINQTDTPRIAAVVGYVRHWFRWENVAMEPIDRATWDAFSERERSLFRMYQPKA